MQIFETSNEVWTFLDLYYQCFLYCQPEGGYEKSQTYSPILKWGSNQSCHLRKHPSLNVYFLSLLFCCFVRTKTFYDTLSVQGWAGRGMGTRNRLGRIFISKSKSLLQLLNEKLNGINMQWCALVNQICRN